MISIHNERGSVIVFVTLMIVLLLIMVGIGLDTGQLTATRSQGQAAVDAAALAAVSGLPVRPNPENEVNQRVAAFYASNDYVKKSSNPIDSGNITYVQYDETTDAITNLPNIINANGVRVALEAGRAITTPVFLTPLMNLFGQSVSSTVDVNVSAVAVLKVLPGVPIAIMNNLCGSSSVNLRDASTSTDNSCWTTYTTLSSPNQVRTLFDASASCSGLPANTDQITIGTSIALDDNSDTSTYQKAAGLFCPGGICPPNKCWIVPVIANGSDCSRSDPSTPIVDWARICPSEVKSDSATKFVKATVTCNQNLFRVDHNLCFSPRLVRDTKSGM
jgi:Flp pilus assembly protein TadG